MKRELVYLLMAGSFFACGSGDAEKTSPTHDSDTPATEVIDEIIEVPILLLNEDECPETAMESFKIEGNNTNFSPVSSYAYSKKQPPGNLVIFSIVVANVDKGEIQRQHAKAGFSLEGETISYTLTFSSLDNDELTVGKYNLVGDENKKNKVAGQILDKNGLHNIGDYKTTGFVEITNMASNRVCGNVDISTEKGNVVKGSFNVAIEEAP